MVMRATTFCTARAATIIYMAAVGPIFCMVKRVRTILCSKLAPRMQGRVTDTIEDFSIAQGDVLDFHGLLTFYSPLTSAITDFIQITTSGSDSIVAVDTNGGADHFVNIATILGVTGLTDEAALLASGAIAVS